VNRARHCSRAASDIRASFSRGPVSSSIASAAICSTEPANMPGRPAITSGIPPEGNAITGTPAAYASGITRVVASRPVDGTSSRSSSAIATSISETHPVNSTGRPAAAARTRAA